MKRSTDAILTTHTGSLPRPDELVDLLYAADEAGAPVPEERVRQAVNDVVRLQIDAGVSVVNDGEMSKVSYSTYVTQRLTGFESKTHVPRRPRPDVAAFPRYAEWNARQQQGAARIKRYACTGPVAYVGQAALRQDLDHLRAAVAELPSDGVADVFMTAASPGVISLFQPNQYYPSNEQYLEALAEAMREEYEAIAAAGVVLQLDCPDLTGLSGTQTPGKPPEDLGLRIEAINHAVRNIPPERMRLHLCWGNYEGPHHLDVPLRDVLPQVLQARPAGLSFEGANPRHAHEYVVFEDISLPPESEKIIIPGVIDSTTNYIEHPELVAQRLVRYAERVGRERVIAGSDCGFGTFAGTPMVHPDIVYAKLAAMADGARIASDALWR